MPVRRAASGGLAVVVLCLFYGGGVTVRRTEFKSDSLGTDSRSLDLNASRVPARRNPRPDWVRSRQIALGKRIADLRRAADLSQEELGNRMGVERRTIQRYENAVTDPRYADLLLLARALRVPLGDLIGG